MADCGVLFPPPWAKTRPKQVFQCTLLVFCALKCAEYLGWLFHISIINSDNALIKYDFNISLGKCNKL